MTILTLSIKLHALPFEKLHSPYINDLDHVN